MRRHPWLTALLAVHLGTAAVAQPSPDPKAAAKGSLERGMALVAEKKFEEALKELRHGYVLSSGAEFLYAMGQVERMRGNCREAINHYRAFLDTNPATGQAEAAKLQIDRCEKQLAPVAAKVEAPAPEPAPEPQVAPSPAVEAPAAVVARPPKPWHSDALGNVLLISGVLAAAGGATLYVVGNLSAQNSRLNLDSYATAGKLGWAQPVGLAVLGASGALLIGSIIRYATMGAAPAEAPTVGLAADGHGGTLVISGGF
jgi:hypothetical protein